MLEDIEFSAPAGQFVSIIGPSGCGTSTLLKLLAGLLEPSRGTVTIGGLSAREAIRRKEIGVADLLARLGGRSDGAAGERSLEMLSLVGLQDAADKYPAELSGGMAQRVSSRFIEQAGGS